MNEVNELAPLAARIAKGRAKYANGCTVLSLIDEAGEVAHAVNKYEPVDRIRDELLDVAAVAMRLYFGEIDRGLEMDGLVQRRIDVRRLSDDDAQAIGRDAIQRRESPEPKEPKCPSRTSPSPVFSGSASSSTPSQGGGPSATTTEMDNASDACQLCGAATDQRTFLGPVCVTCQEREEENMDTSDWSVPPPTKAMTDAVVEAALQAVEAHDACEQATADLPMTTIITREALRSDAMTRLHEALRFWRPRSTDSVSISQEKKT